MIWANSMNMIPFKLMLWWWYRMDAWHCVMSYDKIVFMAFSAYLSSVSAKWLLRNELFHDTTRKGPWMLHQTELVMHDAKSSENRLWRLTHVNVACLSVVTHTFIGFYFLLLCVTVLLLAHSIWWSMRVVFPKLIIFIFPSSSFYQFSASCSVLFIH